MLLRSLVVAGLLLVVPGLVLAAGPAPEAYRLAVTVASPANLAVPTVVELPLPSQYFDQGDFLVVEVGTGKVLPSYYLERASRVTTPLTISASGAVGNPADLLSRYPHPGVRFDVDGESLRMTELTLEASSPSPISVSGLDYVLGPNSARPREVEVRGVLSGGEEKVLLARSVVGSERVSFIPTEVQAVKVRLFHIQPLLLQQISLVETQYESTVRRGLRWLALPGQTYQVYLDSDRSTEPNYGERGDLTSDVGIVTLSPYSLIPNSAYRPADTDGDGVPDYSDNCVLVTNADQSDIDGNGRGDACDDWDRDGLQNYRDNCIESPNPSQVDTDVDGQGDACDEEESRFTEKHLWVPWVGMGGALLVIVLLFIVVHRRSRQVVTSDAASAPNEDGATTPHPDEAAKYKIDQS